MENPTHYIKDKKGKWLGSYSTRGKNPVPPLGFAFLSSSKTEEETKQEFDYKKAREKVQRVLWAKLLLDSSCKIPDNIEKYELESSDALILISSEKDLSTQEDSPIFSDVQKDTISAFLKTRVERVVALQDGTKQTYYAIPGFKNSNNPLHFSLRQTSSPGDAVTNIEVVILQENGEEHYTPKNNDIRETINRYVRDHSVIDSKTRGLLALEDFTVHVDSQTGEVSLLEVSASTDWFLSEITGE